ncbi:hypothetical protein QTG56_23840 (plasmid) [Rossellomorea sp. AcN35-11]|nr:hypothetical protein [Rossellomorea aquimaris]WJV32394.1 hypothetical protein QTG56_23840 [Rossellomorea sp. AcN35-11]
MTATQLVILAFFTPVILIGIVSFAIELIADRSRINKSAPSWTSQSAKIHRPNFATNRKPVQVPVQVPVQKNEPEYLFGEEESNDIPDFNSLADSAAVEELSYSTSQQNEPQLEEVDLTSLQTAMPPNENVKFSVEDKNILDITPENDNILPFEIEGTKKEEKQEFEPSIPTEDMESSIRELIAATSGIPDSVEETPVIETIEEEKTNEEQSKMLSDMEAPPEQENESLEDYTVESPLGINYIEVYKMFGKDVADKVTASPDCALERGVDYVMCGEVNGEFLNCFGETIKLKGLPKDYDSNGEFILLSGQFVTAELFHVDTYMQAIEASNSNDIEVLNVAYS